MPSPVLLQSASIRSGAGVTTVAKAFAGAVTPGSLLLAYIFSETGANKTGTCSAADGVNGAYAPDITNATVGNFLCGIHSFPNTGAGTPLVTATVSAADRINLIIQEWSNILTVSPFDKSASGTGTSNAPSSGATPAISQGNELVVGLGCASSFPTITAGAGFTLDPNSLSTTLAAEYLILTSSSGGQTATFNLSAGPPWQCLCATYKSAGGAVVVRNGAQELMGVGA